MNKPGFRILYEATGNDEFGVQKWRPVESSYLIHISVELYIVR